VLADVRHDREHLRKKYRLNVCPGNSQVKVSERDIREIRRAVYDLIWQTAHLYKDAPGGKLACPQRSKLESYVESKILMLDFMLEKANNESELKEIIEDYLKDLEDNFQAHVYEETKDFLFYRERKKDCCDVISKHIYD
jgi:hypothetical protein